MTTEDVNLALKWSNGEVGRPLELCVTVTMDTMTVSHRHK